MQSTQGSQWPSPLWFCLSLLVKGSPGRLCAAMWTAVIGSV